MSGGSFNYLCDAAGYELTGRTQDLADMARWLRDRGHEREARETERIIERISGFHEELQARAQDLQHVWKAAEWHRSGDWDAESVTSMVEQHNHTHPPDSIIPAKYWDLVDAPPTGIAALMAHHGHTAQTADIAAQTAPGWLKQRTNLAPNPGGTMPDEREPATKDEYVAKALHDKYCQFNDWTFIHSGRAQDLTVAQWAMDAAAEWDAAHPSFDRLEKPDSLTSDDFRWAEDTEEWANQFERDELLWIVQTANDAIRIKEAAEAERKAQAEEAAHWDKRRAELIEQFNGGPLNVANGQPIPTMALQAVEYIIETERNAEKGQG